MIPQYKLPKVVGNMKVWKKGQVYLIIFAIEGRWLADGMQNMVMAVAGGLKIFFFISRFVFLFYLIRVCWECTQKSFRAIDCYELVLGCALSFRSTFFIFSTQGKIPRK